jgi:hypothetical protein
LASVQKWGLSWTSDEFVADLQSVNQTVGLDLATEAFLGIVGCIFDAFTRLKAAFCLSV